MAEDDDKRDDAWCTMLEWPHLIEGVPVNTTQAWISTVDRFGQIVDIRMLCVVLVASGSPHHEFRLHLLL